jgi:hypothetical protein
MPVRAWHSRRSGFEDSAFLFYAGQLRARFDQKCFPAKGTGGDSPFLAYAALSQSLGSTINPAVMAEPKAFAKAIDRLKNWSPKAPKEYTKPPNQIEPSSSVEWATFQLF